MKILSIIFIILMYCGCGDIKSIFDENSQPLNEQLDCAIQLNKRGYDIEIIRTPDNKVIFIIEGTDMERSKLGPCGFLNVILYKEQTIVYKIQDGKLIEIRR